MRDTRRDGMNEVYERVKEIARGASIMADVDYEINLISGIHEILPNRTGGAKMQANLELLGDIEYTAEEEDFGKGIQEATGKPQVGMDGKVKAMLETKEHPGGGSTDSGDVSWIVPHDKDERNDSSQRNTMAQLGSSGMWRHVDRA